VSISANLSIKHGVQSVQTCWGSVLFFFFFFFQDPAVCFICPSSMFLLPHTYMQALAPPQMVYVRDGSSAIKSTKVQEIDERTRSPDESC
jgi:hypothetical protein